ncbi:chitotriosidase-1-like [Ixodes scapularis]
MTWAYHLKVCHGLSFIESAVGVLRDARLDGLDLDWEFPSVFDRRQFATFLEEVFKAFRESPYGPFLLSVAVPAQSTLAIAYDIPTMARNVDFVNLMTYDLHIFKWYTPLTGHNSPLFSRSDELGYFATLNMQSSTELWTSMGMPKSKIMVGIPTYGLSWALLNAQSAGVGSVAVGQSKEGDGFVSYPKVCEFLRSGGTRHFDDESMVPFATNDRTWISYDDQESVAIKARWILAENFSGTMTFSLNSDDWQGTCGHGAFPLQKSILEAT